MRSHLLSILRLACRGAALVWGLLALEQSTQAQTLAVRPYRTANGLPQSSVYCLRQDRQGRLWAGTQGGVCVYDGQGFTIYNGHAGLPDSHVRAVAPAPDGATVWLGHQYAGVSALGADERVHPVRLPGLRKPGPIATLWAGPKGELWVGTEGQGLWWLRCRPASPAAAPDTLSKHWTASAGLPSDSVLWLGRGLHGRQWAATPHGLAVLDQASGQPLSAEQAALPAALRARINSFCRVSDSVAWVATDRGLLRVCAARPASGWQVRRFTAAQGLCANQVMRVVQDDAGQVWATTPAGLCRASATRANWHFTCFVGQEHLENYQDYDLLVDREGSVWTVSDNGIDQHLADERFTQFTSQNGLTDPEVQAIAQVRPNELWVATRLGINRLLLGPNGPQPPFQTVPMPAASQGGRYVRCLVPDSRGGIWVGTLDEGARRYDLRTGRWTIHNQGVPGLAGQRVASVAEDRRGRIWLATRHGGLTVFDPNKKTYRTFRRGDNGLGSDSFWQIFKDHAGQLWLGSNDEGLLRIDTDHDTFRRVDGHADRLSVGSISEDPVGRLWLGTIGNGLLCYEPASGRLRAYGLTTGLQSLNPYFAQCDSAGRVWVGTNLGVDLFDPRTGRAQSYGRAEGFSGGETNQNAVLLGPAGRLWVGTVEGLMLYDPAQAHRLGVPPPTSLTGLRVALRDTTLTPGLMLPAQLNSLSFDFLGVSLARPGRVRYQYRLRGLSDAWLGPVAGTSATFANLAPGAYTFEVRASNGEGGWSPQPAVFSFGIAAPWWRRWWAMLLYAGAFGLALYGVRRRTRRQERDRAERQLERQALGHLQELDRVKTDFFTNISHELRTPLTLILGPAEVLAEAAPDAASRQRGNLVLTQARKLLALINQLLDLSRLDAGALRLRPRTGDVVQLTRHVVASFSSLADGRGVALRLASPPGSVPLVFDAEKIDEVLTNLVANALRFTPYDGQVTVRVVDCPPTVAAPAGTVELVVEDTGPGIGAEHLPHLFDRFYQASGPAGEAANAAPRQGTGIGLALVRELVALHGGAVEVSSAPGQGACFVVRLPRGFLEAEPETSLDAPNQVERAPSAPSLALVSAAYPPQAAEPAPDAELVLLMEDNEEVQAFIADTLAPAGYRLLRASDGTAGLALAQAEVPDLIICDVMMPGLDGYGVCTALKADPATSHIPVVLLTARSGPDDRLRGLEIGAQAYVPKPFRPRELQAQVRSLLHLSQQNRARFQQPASVLEPAAILPPLVAAEPTPLAAHQAAVAALPSLDQAFLAKFEAAVLAHLSDENYGVDQLGADLNLSRTQLHRKLKALTGQAPGEYLRHTRLLRALALLQARVGTVAEVAYQVGYGSPAHFSTAFSRQFGYPPSAVSKE
jgi:signal transduction histidine kinase/ligand-binding sensor domain-containing protein/DNA-binding response OmpR family regulator